MAQKLKLSSVVTIATAGVAQAISASDTRTPSVTLCADPLNTGDVYVGDSSVASTNGIILEAGECLEIAADHTRGNSDELSLSDIYVDTETNGNKVRVYYLGRR